MKAERRHRSHRRDGPLTCAVVELADLEQRSRKWTVDRSASAGESVPQPLTNRELFIACDGSARTVAPGPEPVEGRAFSAHRSIGAHSNRNAVGTVYEVSDGGMNLLPGKDVMPLVARDGIEPPTPAFQGCRLPFSSDDFHCPCLSTVKTTQLLEQ